MGVYNIDGVSVNDIVSVYSGKTLSILGDSISTFAGYVPYPTFYDGTNCGVSSVHDTWWDKLMTAFNMTLNKNNSWSGSRVTTTVAESSAGCMTRCQDLGTNPDVIIVYMGINDFDNEVSLGTYDGNGNFPTDTTTFREAYAIMVHKILSAYPTSELWVCTLPPCEKNGSIGAPEKNDSGVLLDDFNEAIRNIAHLFGAKVLEVASCGLTYENMSIYMGDWDSSTQKALHPNAAGHSLIANSNIRQMDCGVRKRFSISTN